MEFITPVRLQLSGTPSTFRHDFNIPARLKHFEYGHPPVKTNLDPYVLTVVETTTSNSILFSNFNDY